MKKKHIVLIGFMGSGKTSVGTELARLLGFQKIDLDDVIVDREGRPITEIFKTMGEAYFRELERRILIEITDGDRASVLCSGGGVVLDPRNIATIKGSGVSVWLKAKPETVYSRIYGDSSRPVLGDEVSVEKIAAILALRLPKYRKAADIVVDTDGKAVSEIAKEIVAALRTYN